MKTILIAIAIALLCINASSALYLTKCQVKTLIKSMGLFNSEGVRLAVRSDFRCCTALIPLIDTLALPRRALPTRAPTTALTTTGVSTTPTTATACFPSPMAA
jgi:hypothetical protein